ncbi:MAG: recombinase family protein [Aeromonas veronii]
MPIAILYSRFSSGIQAEGHSQERQQTQAEDFCARHTPPLELSSLTFKDLGISGWKSNAKRDGLEQLIEAVELGRIPKGSFILVEAADRLSRQGFMHVMLLVRRLVATGCKFVTIDNGQIYDHKNIENLSGALPLIISADLALQESERKSFRVKQAKNAVRRNRVLQGKMPFWIDLVDGKAVLNSSAQLMRRIIDMRLEGKSPLIIAKTLNEEGIRTTRDKQWYAETIRTLFEQTAIYGSKTYFEMKDGSYKPAEEVANLFPAIATKDEFLRLSPNKPPRGKYPSGPFSGLLKCSKCGAHIRSNGKRGEIQYRSCANAKIGKCEETGYIRDTDQILSEQLKKLAFIKSPQVASVDYEKEINELEAMLENLERDRQASKGKAFVYKMILEDMDETNTKLEALKQKRDSEAASNTDVNLEYICSIEDEQHKNSLYKTVIDRIEITRFGTTRVMYDIRFKNNHRTVFLSDYERKTKTHIAKFKSDTEELDKFISGAVDGLEPWEICTGDRPEGYLSEDWE